MKDIRGNRDYLEILREIVISSQLVVAGGSTADEAKGLKDRLAEILNEWVLAEAMLRSDRDEV